MESFTKLDLLLQKIRPYGAKAFCLFGIHRWTWKLKKGETISGDIPDRAKCEYCGCSIKDTK